MGLRSSLGLRKRREELQAPTEWQPAKFEGTRPPNVASVLGGSFERRIDIAKLIRPGWVGIELGVARGEFSEALLANAPLKKLWSVDMWAGDRGHDLWEYLGARLRLLKFGGRSIVLKLRFDEALPRFPDNFFDFIYVDGYAHTGEDEGRTLRDWWPKLKAGGLFAGDDYSPRWPKVMQEVDVFAAEHDLSLMLIEPQSRANSMSKSPSWLAFKSRQDKTP
ncbi:hypothetical protein IZ6_11070 [Terrihabitans soli]|uniref:Class I SAM-dependent methyltransferase n=1 Tax=Terrihabitans soli TaxID=708113 RepID=A0A6S6QSY5_9HYPH|nr:class I SAM-dependent methyltransferase [Terrihabitans soli]BCJ90372.1 hypothetical protein IZ6_11070 [Terrihabitans soli]